MSQRTTWTAFVYHFCRCRVTIVLKCSTKTKFLYDCSWPSQHFVSPGMWLYTLDIHDLHKTASLDRAPATVGTAPGSCRCWRGRMDVATPVRWSIRVWVCKWHIRFGRNVTQLYWWHTTHSHHTARPTSPRKWKIWQLALSNSNPFPSCRPTEIDELVDFMIGNFNRSYNSNRPPFG